jgi:hypothetical protein
VDTVVHCGGFNSDGDQALIGVYRSTLLVVRWMERSNLWLRTLVYYTQGSKGSKNRIGMLAYKPDTPWQAR